MRILLLLLIVAIIYVAYKWRPAGNSARVPTVQEGPAETAGRTIDGALHTVGEAVEDLGERLQEKTEPVSTRRP